MQVDSPADAAAGAVTGAVIHISGLSKVFKDFWGRPKVQALEGVELTVARGEIFGIVGPNGSGKTTLIKILLGLLFPSAGTVRVFGENVFRTRNKLRLGFLPEQSCFYEHLTGLETLHFYGKLLGLQGASRRARVDDLIELAGLKEAARRPLGEYSSGMLRRIGMAQALLADPELLILDEPTNGLDPLGMDEVQKLLLDLKRRGKTLLVSSHLLGEMEEVCDRMAIFCRGRVLAQGRLDELLQAGGTGDGQVSGTAANMSRLKEIAAREHIAVEFAPRRLSLKKLFLELLDRELAQRAPVALPPATTPQAPETGPDSDYLGSLARKP